MTQPTQAQIEAAAKAIQLKLEVYPPETSPVPWARWQTYSVAAKAALTAAAQVGADRDDRGWPIQKHQHLFENGVCVGCGYTAARVGEQTELEALEEHIALQNRIKEECNATIERCAQVAEEHTKFYGYGKAIAAAIRQLRDAP